MNELEKIAQTNDVSEKTKTDLLDMYQEFFKQTEIWSENASTIIVESENDKKQMELAKTARLELKKIRTGVEKMRKQTKSDALKFGKAVDSMAKLIKEKIEPIEKYLFDQENFVQIREEKRIIEMIADRTNLLNEISNDCYQLELHQYDLRLMSQEKFEKIVKFEKSEAENAVKEHEKKLAKEKIEREEIKKLRVENVKLKANALNAINEIKRKHYNVQEKNLDVFATDEEIFENWRQGLVDYITDNIITITDNKLCELVDDICYAINREINQDEN